MKKPIMIVNDWPSLAIVVGIMIVGSSIINALIKAAGVPEPFDLLCQLFLCGYFGWALGGWMPFRWKQKTKEKK